MRPFRDERGFTTTSMVLSMLITLALMFTAAQVYRLNTLSSEVQDIADAASLSAQNQVAEFMVIARFCDAVVLTLSLTGITVTGLGIAALCTPPTAALSKGLLSAGKNIVKARDKFAKRAAKALGKLQEALPYFAAACAASVAAANNGGSAGANYLGAAMLVPFEGEPIEVDLADGTSELMNDIDEQADEIREKAKRAEEASQEANRCKERAFKRDCGDAPAYCMYERASTLAGLSGSANPLYESVDTWTFSVALQRAKTYYRARLSSEAPDSYSIEEQARSSLREKFYRYAVELMNEAYVHETDDSFEANFPHLPSNTDEMRLTSLYTDQVYPVTAEEIEVEAPEPEGEEGEEAAEPVTEVKYLMHAWMGCPEVQEHGVYATESISYMEEAGLETCPTCGFRASSLGKVAAASTSIDNGFEYHYEAVADEAFLYEKARHEADAPKAEVKEKVGGLFEKLGEVLKNSAGRRIDPSPPGRYGAIAFVVNAGSTPAAGPFANGFVSSAGSLGPRAAISAATLVDEGSDQGKTVLNSALDNLRENGGAAVGAAGMVLDVWSWMLKAYGDGQQALLSGIESGLNSLPLVGASGLGTWASEKLGSAIEEVGLQPAKVGSLKAAIVNSGHVAAKGEDSFSTGFVGIKQRVIAHPMASTDLFSAVLSDAEETALRGVRNFGDSIEVASIELIGEGGPSIPITIPIPESVKSFAVSQIGNLFGRLRSFYLEVTGVRVWE